MRDSIEVPMISRMWSRLLPIPSPPMASWAGHAIFLSSTMIGLVLDWAPCSLAAACSTILSDRGAGRGQAAGCPVEHEPDHGRGQEDRVAGPAGHRRRWDGQQP